MALTQRPMRARWNYWAPAPVLRSDQTDMRCFGPGAGRHASARRSRTVAVSLEASWWRIDRPEDAKKAHQDRRGSPEAVVILILQRLILKLGHRRDV
jgi:hypothetical protein